MRNDVRLRARTVSASGALCDRFLESVFFTGNGRMGLRGCALFRPEPRPLDAGLFVAGIFDRLSGHTELTDFVALPSPRLEITLGGERRGSAPRCGAAWTSTPASCGWTTPSPPRAGPPA